MAVAPIAFRMALALIFAIEEMYRLNGRATPLRFRAPFRPSKG